MELRFFGLDVRRKFESIRSQLEQNLKRRDYG